MVRGPGAVHLAQPRDDLPHRGVGADRLDARPDGVGAGLGRVVHRVQGRRYRCLVPPDPQLGDGLGLVPLAAGVDGEDLERLGGRHVPVHPDHHAIAFLDLAGLPVGPIGELLGEPAGLDAGKGIPRAAMSSIESLIRRWQPGRYEPTPSVRREDLSGTYRQASTPAAGIPG